MKPMSPEDAQLILNGADFSGGYLDIGYRRALETIAGAHTEYAVEHQQFPYGQWHQVTGWSHEPPLNGGYPLVPGERIVRRYIIEQEEV